MPDRLDFTARQPKNRLVQLRVSAYEQEAWRREALRRDVSMAHLLRSAMRNLLAGTAGGAVFL